MVYWKSLSPNLIRKLETFSFENFFRLANKILKYEDKNLYLK